MSLTDEQRDRIDKILADAVLACIQVDEPDAPRVVHDIILLATFEELEGESGQWLGKFSTKMPLWVEMGMLDFQLTSNRNGVE